MTTVPELFDSGLAVRMDGEFSDRLPSQDLTARPGAC